MPRAINRPPVTRERPSSFVSLLSGWVQQGIESFFATQRILVDLATRQNTTAMNTIRRELSRDDARAKDEPKSILVELAVEGTSNYIEAQRVLLDLAQEQSDIVLNGAAERVSGYQAAATTAHVLRRSVETFIEMQQNFITMANKRAQNILQDTDADPAAASIASEAMSEFVRAQKKFLDVVAEETSPEAKREHGRAGRTDLVELSRNATDSFIEAQKKLLDLAGQQMHVNTQAVGRAFDVNLPIRITPMADLVGEGVRSFVDAEKALVDSMTKARKHAAEPVSEAEPAPKRGRRTQVKKSRARAVATV